MDSAPKDMNLENIRCTQLITRNTPTKVGDWFILLNNGLDHCKGVKWTATELRSL